MDVHDPGIRIAAANALARSLHSVPVEQLQRVCDVFERARSEGLRGRLHDRDLARLHERLGHWSEAIRCWEEYRNGDPPQGFCATGRDAEELWVRQSGIARCALRAGQRERAWAAFRKLPGFDGDERAASLQFEFLGRIGRFEGRWNRVEALGAGELGDADALFGLARVVRHGFLGGSVGVAEEREELIGLGRLLGRLGDPAVARLTAALTAGDPMAVELAGDTGLASLIPALERALEADAFRLHRWMIEAALRRRRESR
jgi:hypothetical protein